MGASVDQSVYLECVHFLNKEAELLNRWQLQEWLELLADEIDYRIPIRQTKAQGALEFDEVSRFMHEDKETLKTRVARLETGFAWAEEPRSRVRHFISNARVEKTEREGFYLVISNLLLTRIRGDATLPDILVGERHDILGNDAKGWKLFKRTVYLDNTSLPTQSLSFFI